MTSTALLCAGLSSLTLTDPAPADTLRNIQLQETVVILESAKDSRVLRKQPVSVTQIGWRQLEQQHVQSIKGVSNIVPNLYVPDYGSHLTTAAYVRGIGSRINTPAVGLYVDNIPFVDKSAFDFALYDVKRIDVLRGPQSTLYGRNAMGGLVCIYTESPLWNPTHTDVNLSASSYNNYKMSGTHYRHVSDKFAFSLGAGYNYKGGYFQNEALDERVDCGQDGAARLRAVYCPSDRVLLDFHANYEYTDEGGYPYFFEGWDSDAAQQKDFFQSSLAGTEGTLAYNRRSSYNRHLLNTGLSAKHNWTNMVLTNLVGFQWLKDDMMMDQDFTPRDIYTLQQRQNTKTISDEIVLKGDYLIPNRLFPNRWEWTSGVNVLYQHNRTQAPVTFCKDGIGWLNGMMDANANRFMPSVQAGPMTMDFNFADRILGDALVMDGTYKTPLASAAIFHQSSFGLYHPALSLTLGARLDYERLWFDYSSGYNFQHEYALSGHLTMPGMERDIPMVPAATYDAEAHIEGSLAHDYLQFLPKASLMYELPRRRGNVYATVSRGFRSGGYNIQMFSEVLQGRMTADIMTDVRDVTVPVLEAQTAVPANTKEQVSGILNQMAARPDYDIDALTRYNPEYAWNYEVGTHLDLFNHRLRLDLAGFYIDITDQQLSRMSETGLGRITVNAGRSYSTGAEASVVYRPQVEGLIFRANYGYTLAKFREYNTVDTNGAEVDYAGNYVPFVPQHTVSASGEYTWTLADRRALDYITLALDYTGAGSIYWTESNSRKQPFYNLLGANLTFGLFDNLKLTIWARNLTNTKYDTFYFETMHRGFAQHARPFEAGIDVKFQF